MNAGKLKMVGRIEQELGLNTGFQADAVDAEWIILYRMRLEGVSVWSQDGGHVGWPIDSFSTRKAYVAMLAAQDEINRNLVRDSLQYCLENDPFMHNANYPLLEYYLWTAMYVSNDEKPFRPLAIPVELCEWLRSIKPEEYLHYRPIDWCLECGYRYPALPYGIGHDAREFLITRYSKDQIEAMDAPFRGKACFVCGGEIMNQRWRGPKSKGWEPEGVKWLEDSPAGKLLEEKRQEWLIEIDSIELDHPQYCYAPHGSLDEAEAAAKADFKQRRANKPMIRIEHRPGVDSIMDLWRRQGRCAEKRD
jgi:hypothetical protein